MELGLLWRGRTNWQIACLGAVLAGLAPLPAVSVTTLAPGDAAVVTVNANAPKGFDLIPLVDLDGGAQISVTDNAWTNTGWKSTEGTVVYTAPSGIVAGTVLAYRGVTENGFVADPGFNLSTGGDTLLAYQGPATNPAFVYGVGWAQATPWIISGDPLAGQSYIPEVLSSEEHTLLSLGRKASYQYLAAAGTAGTRAELLSLLDNSSHWTNHNLLGFPAFTPDFSVVTTGQVQNPLMFQAQPGDALVELTWALNDLSDPVMIGWHTNANLGMPAGPHSVGDTLPSGARVIFQGIGQYHVQTGLTNDCACYFKAWSVRDGTNYSVGVTAVATPRIGLLAAPVLRDPTDVRTNQFTATWSNAVGASAYLVDVATNSAFRHPTAGRRSTIAAGDLMIVTVNAVEPKGFDLVPLVDLDPGTVLFFTDRPWSGTNWLGSEGTVVYTAPGTIPAGVVLPYRGASAHGFTADPAFNPSGSGDTILAYQGSAVAPEFLYGLGWAIATPWITNGIPGPGQSYIPPPLSPAANTIVSLGSKDNYQYRASVQNPRAGLLALAADRTSWTNSDLAAYDPLFPDIFVTDAGNADDFVPGYRAHTTTALSAPITGLTGGVTYFYRVRATNASGMSAVSTVSNITTLGGLGPVTPPPGFSAASANQRVDLAWSLNPAGDAVMLAYNTAASFGAPVGVYTSGQVIAGGGMVIYHAHGTGFRHEGLTNGTTYYYQAWSVRNGALYSTGVVATAIPAALAAPGILPATAVHNRRFMANWTAPDRATGYRLYVATNPAFRGYLPDEPGILAPGELAMATVNAALPKGFDFIPLVNLSPGTVIKFTDRAWTNTGWRGSEGLVTYTATGTVAAGSVLTFRGSNEHGFIKSGSFDLSTSGDTLLVYQGDDDTPGFLYGIGWATPEPWITNGLADSGHSYVPAPLSAAAGTILTPGPRPNYQYLAEAGVSGSRSQLLAGAANPLNWTGQVVAGFAAFIPGFSISGDVAGVNDYVPGYQARPVSLTDALVTGLLDNATCYYRVRATNDEEVSPYSAITSAATTAVAPAYDDWAQGYHMDPSAPNGAPSDHYDADPASNWEEYLADTDPTDPLSCYANEITTLSGARVILLQAGPPTTNSRRYDVWCNTNLLAGDWQALGYDQPGQPGGAAVIFVITNGPGQAHYRTGVRLPD